MRSDLIKINSTGEGITEALRQADAVAVYKTLPNKSRLQLRLLCEEMMGMFRTLTGEVEAEFFIEDREDVFELHLETDTTMDSKKRRDLLSASSSGRNEAVTGMTGKLRNVFEQLFEPASADSTKGVFVPGFGAPSAASAASWSLSEYRKSVKGDAEAWDELEKSVVASIADEIKVGIRGGKVEMIIYKKF
jgi:hypothetical protein